MSSKLTSALFALFLPLSALAQWGGAQPFQPGRWNYQNRVAGGMPEPVFDVDFDSSVTPLVGTAGTYARASTQLYATGLNTLASASSGAAAVGVHPNADESATTYTKGGLMKYGAIKNWLLYAADFTDAAWQIQAGAGAVADQTTAPDGTATADQLTGTGATSSLYQDAGFGLANNESVVGATWLKVDSGTYSATLYVWDDVETTTCNITVTAAWKQFVCVHKATGAASGNINFEINIKAPGLKTLYGWGASLVGVNETRASDLRWDFELVPTIITTSATASLANANLFYGGAEIAAEFTEQSVAAWIYFPAHDATNCWDERHLWNWYNVGWSSLNAAYFTSAGNDLYVRYQDGGAVNTSFEPTQTGWHHLVVASKNGDNETFADSVSVNTAATATAAKTATYIVPAGEWHTGTAAYEQMGSIIMGRFQVYDHRLTQDEVTAIFNEQKGDYGL